MLIIIMLNELLCCLCAVCLTSELMYRVNIRILQVQVTGTLLHRVKINEENKIFIFNKLFSSELKRVMTGKSQLHKIHKSLCARSSM